jgi:hypothetical protein
MIRNCDICGKEFNALSGTKSCSSECREEHRKRYIYKWKRDNSPKCCVCGKPHGQYGHQFIYPDRKTMCKSCYLKNCTGPKNHAWRGGTRFKGKRNTNCYMESYAPEHKRAVRNYVLEHILVWEREHGKSLPKGYIIHHLNGIKYDNRIENLVALPQKKHHSWLVNAALQERIRELEGSLKNKQGISFYYKLKMEKEPK